MPWFKVDDKFHQHPKVLQIPRSVRAAAVGTWTLAGTWSASAERDGFVPAYLIDEVGGSLEGAAALVEVKLWRKRPKGYQFVNWSEFQPTRAENDERREKERVRKDAYRKSQTARKSGGASDDVPAGQMRGDNTPGPVPDPDPDPNHERLSSSVSGATDDGSAHGDLSVDNSRVVQHLTAMTGRQVEVTDAYRVIGLVLQRNPSPKRPTQYVLAAITRDPIGWQNYLDTGTEPE